MSPPPTYSVTPGDAGRSRILSWGALLGITVLAVGALVLVFPKRDLLSQLRDETDRGNSELTIAYLQNIIRTEPKDLALRLLLVEKLLAANQLDAARSALADSLPLARGTPAGKDSWDGWDLAWWQARLRAAVQAHNSALITESANELTARLAGRVRSADTSVKIFATINAAHELSATLSDTANPVLAASAMAVQDQLLERLLMLPSSSTADLSRGATLALAAGQFVRASEFFFAARRKTMPADARYKLLQKGFRPCWQAVRARLPGKQPCSNPSRYRLPTPATGGWLCWR